MKPIAILCIAALVCGCTANPQQAAQTSLAPTRSYHQHLLSPASVIAWSNPTPPATQGADTLHPLTAEDLIAQLDAARIRRAIVLSVAYLYGDPRRQPPDEYAQVRAENDWTSKEVARFPKRLVGFCGVSPLRPYALTEIRRCRSELGLSGLKLHFGNSGVDLRNAEHVSLLRAVFSEANALKLPIVVHLRTRDSNYGALDAQVFLKEILPAARSVPVQIAHLAGAGPGYPPNADEAFAVFADAVAAGDPATRRLYFDVTTVATSNTSTETAALIAKRLRQVGLKRILFGADLSIGGNPQPGPAWERFRTKIPLTEAEFGTIANNTTPYLH